MKTIITLLNGEEHVLDGRPEELIKKMQKSNGDITVDIIGSGSKTIDVYEIVTFKQYVD